MIQSVKNQQGQQANINKAGKRLNCTEGVSFPCGSACFSIGRKCLKPLQVQAMEAANDLMKQLGDPLNISANPSKNNLNKKLGTSKPQEQVKKKPKEKSTEKVEPDKKVEKVEPGKPVKLKEKELGRQEEVPVEVVLKQLQALEKKQTEITNQIKERHQQSLQKTKQLMNDGNDSDALNEAQSSLEELKQKKKELDDKVLTKARELLYTKNPSKLKVTGGLVHDMDQQKDIRRADKKKIEEWSKGVNEFKKLIGVDTIDDIPLSIKGIATSNPSKDRSHYNRNNDTVFMADKAGIPVVIHEIAHFLQEKDPTIQKKIEDFFNERTKDDEWEKLSDLTGLPYRDDEVTKKDKWLRPYMGKNVGQEILRYYQWD